MTGTGQRRGAVILAEGIAYLALVAFLRQICKERAQMLQLLRPGFVD
jgi:hypothetical protein